MWSPLFDALRGERILLRPYRLEDAAEAQAAVAESRDHLWPWEELAHELLTVDETRDRIHKRIAHWLLRDWFAMGIWDQRTGRQLGGMGLHPLKPGGWSIPAFSLGYWVRKSEEGHGYIGEAVRLITDYAFDHLGAQRVEIRCDARNERSAAVAWRLGFVAEGRLRNVGRALDGVIFDGLVFALTPADPRWPKR
jgi:RimJ/RimL family protein N-acetyltransferase